MISFLQAPKTRVDYLETSRLLEQEQTRLGVLLASGQVWVQGWALVSRALQNPHWEEAWEPDLVPAQVSPCPPALLVVHVQYQVPYLVLAEYSQLK